MIKKKLYYLEGDLSVQMLKIIRCHIWMIVFLAMIVCNFKSNYKNEFVEILNKFNHKIKHEHLVKFSTNLNKEINLLVL
jgi:hypothetical protein